MYNIVVCATNFDEFKDDGWIIKGDPTELCQRFSTWEPRVGKLCALVDNVRLPRNSTVYPRAGFSLGLYPFNSS
jgi:hypothetical protein